MASFESTKSEIVSCGLGHAIGLTVSSTWAQIVEKIKSVINRGTLNWSENNTTKTVDAGYYSGGTLDSRPSYNNGYNAGVTAADNRSNPNSTNYKTGYNAGVAAGKQAMGSTLSKVFSHTEGTSSYTGTYTATSAGYYLAIAVAAGTGGNNGNRVSSISTNGTQRSYTRWWIGDNGDSTSQIGCRQCVALMIAYLNVGNTFTLSWTTNYNVNGFVMVFKLG